MITRNLRLEGAFELVKITRSTSRFVGVDLAELANKAGNLAMKIIVDQRKFNLSLEPMDGESNEDWWTNPWSTEEMKMLSITMSDFEEYYCLQEAAKIVKWFNPLQEEKDSLLFPNVKWDNVGGLDLLRQEFDCYLVSRIKYPEDYEVIITSKLSLLIELDGADQLWSVYVIANNRYEMNEAAMATLEGKLNNSSSDRTPLTINGRHFELALEKISPSVSN
ncbi:hypothetical protein LguiA_019331 [Lonicera macranthoides]